MPGQSVQGNVAHSTLGSGRLYQCTAIDEVTRYRLSQIYDHNSIKSAIAFIEEVHHRASQLQSSASRPITSPSSEPTSRGPVMTVGSSTGTFPRLPREQREGRTLSPHR